MILTEYFPLPTTDSLYRFLYRIDFNGTFSAWAMDYVSVFAGNGNSPLTLDQILQNFIVERYRKMVLDAMPKQGPIPDVYFQLLKENGVRLVLCEILPKKDPVGYLKEIV